MRIIIDLDGTICDFKREGESYSDVRPKPGVIEFIKKLKNQGHYIIIYTARNMKTCESNVGMVLKNVGMITLKWLDQNNIEYDEIFFGKPNGDIYIDDRSLRFDDWNNLSIEKIKLLAKEQ